MKANTATKKIEMTKREFNAIGRTSTPEFKEYATLKSIFSDFEIKVVSKKSNPLLKKLTFNFMENYIKNSERENIEDILADFEIMKKEVSTFEVREWFLGTFPEIRQADKERRDADKKRRENAEKILNEAKQNKIEYLRKVA